MIESGTFSPESRVDLHVHSIASTDVGSAAGRQLKLGGESFTDPQDIYDVTKRRGMDFVTISDHNTLEGAKQIEHLPGSFLSEEITTRFPDTKKILHVLAWGLNREDHEDLQPTRGSVFDLVGLLSEREIPHALAHPLFRMGAEITPEDVEKMMVLFPLWEGRNGARTEKSNILAVRIAETATRERLKELADKHDLEEPLHASISLTGGSDDHGGFDIATTWTVAEAGNVSELLDALRTGRVWPEGEHGSTQKLAHALASVAFGSLQRSGHKLPENASTMVGPFFSTTAGSASERHQQVSGAASWAVSAFGEKARRGIGLGDLSKLGPSVSASALAIGLQLPYLLTSNHHASTDKNLGPIQEAFFGTTEQDGDAPRALVFTDTFEETNGVAGTMRRLAEAAGNGKLPLTVVAVAEQAQSQPGLEILKQEWELKIPMTDNSVHFPKITDVLNIVETANPDIIHLPTPGPAGLAGLAVAKLVGIPTVGSYHTELGPYALHLTEDVEIGHFVSWYVDKFYRQCDVVSAPTNTIAESLRQRKMAEVDIWGRGVDTNRYNPSKRNEALRSELLGDDGEALILYVGRTSKEKRLDILLKAFESLHGSVPGARLAIVGDGPERQELERTKPEGVIFLGEKQGEELAEIYASADVFGFASTTDTFGQVLLEAGASGLPVVAAAVGGAVELVEDGRTGFLTTPDNHVAMAMAFRELLTDKTKTETMSRQAREAAEQRTWSRSYEELLQTYERAIRVAGNLLRLHI